MDMLSIKGVLSKLIGTKWESSYLKKSNPHPDPWICSSMFLS